MTVGIQLMKATLHLALPSRKGRFTSMTQYNDGTTALDINDLTSEEWLEIANGATQMALQVARGEKASGAEEQHTPSQIMNERREQMATPLASEERK